MFTVLTVGMALSGVVAIEPPVKAAADRPALVQVAAYGMFGGKRFHKPTGYGMHGKPKFIIDKKLGKPAGIGHVEYEKFRKPVVIPQINATGPAVLRPVLPNKGNGAGVIQPLPGNGAAPNNNGLSLQQRLDQVEQKR